VAKIFDREEAVRTLTLVKPILDDLIACMAELRELEAHPDTDENTLRIRSAELNSEINRYIGDLEEIGCYVSSTDELVVRFPALRGHRFGFYELKNKGLAWLENKEFTHAEQTFEALHDAQPEQALPLRNLAITRTMMVADDDSLIYKDRTKNASAWNDAVKLARDTLEKLAKQNKPLSQMLAGRISLREGDTTRGIQESSGERELRYRGRSRRRRAGRSS